MIISGGEKVGDEGWVVKLVEVVEVVEAGEVEGAFEQVESE